MYSHLDDPSLEASPFLPFSLTRAQERVVLEIKNDFKNSFPMKRLVQGDVGSGKTLVSALAALHIIQSGHQVALMAPTELLAEQHFHNFKEWFSSSTECFFLSKVSICCASNVCRMNC